MLIDLSDKVAIVTGAGTGIGRAIAELLSSQGVSIALIGRRKDKLESTREVLKGKQSLVLGCDVTDRDSVAQMVEKVSSQFGIPSILINNAGYNTRPRQTSDISYQSWDLTLDINLTGTFNCVRAVLPLMREIKEGTIVNISSIAGKTPTVTAGVAYSASKHGVISLTGSINDEECRNRIRATVVCPGETETDILDQRPEPVSKQRRLEMLQPEDVAEAVSLAVRLPKRASLREIIIKPRIAYL